MLNGLLRRCGDTSMIGSASRGLRAGVSPLAGNKMATCKSPSLPLFTNPAKTAGDSSESARVLTMDVLTYCKNVFHGRMRTKTQYFNDVRYIVFDDHMAFPHDTKVPFAIFNKPGEYYTLFAVLGLCNKKDGLQHSTYVKECSAAGVVAVTRHYRKPISDFLAGLVFELPKIYDPTLPPTHPIPVARLQNEPTEPERKRQKLDHKSHWLNSMLNVKPEGNHDTAQLRSLNDNLTVDRIALLKKKKQMNQKKNIANLAGTVEAAAGLQEIPAAKDVKVCRERIWKTRRNCMNSLTKDFENIHEILKSLKTIEAAEAQERKNGPAGSSASKQPQKPAPGYSRYDQEIFTKEMNFDFNIDTEISFVGQNFTNLAKPQPKLPIIPVEKKEVPPVVKPAPSSISLTVAKPEPPMPRKRTNKTPIIIIPGGMAGTLINVYNVRDILQDMTFITPDEKKASGTKRDSEVQIHKKRGEVTVPYRVIENPSRLSDEEWERVVAVFVMGPTWQFKGWKFGGNPVEIFSNIPAFHLHYDDMKIDKNVSQWNVTFIPVSRDKRHLDKARLAKFWDTLDRHMVKHKNNLRF